MKLKDESLEKVSGGTREESEEILRELQGAGINTSEGIAYVLKMKFNIDVREGISTNNAYKDLNTWKRLTHEEVMSRIKGGLQD